jgi:hypothetical protein
VLLYKLYRNGVCVLLYSKVCRGAHKPLL